VTIMNTRLVELLDDRLLGLRLVPAPERDALARGQQRWTCPTCGARAAGRDRFCSRCGRALGAALRPSAEGTVTIAFTDIEDYSGLLHHHTRVEIEKLLAFHNELVRHHVYESGGFEVKSLGDGFMLAFSSARGAIRCAMGIQRSLAEHNRMNPGGQLGVRIGLNSGDAVREGDDFFGLAVSFAARVTEKAQGGQILASELTRGLAGCWTGVRFLDRGHHVIKGFPGRHRIYEVEWSQDRP
jgi:class 3 adenylate cyclase